MDFTGTYKGISELVQKGKAKDIGGSVQSALDAGAPAKDILEKGLLVGMNVVGEQFKNNEVFVPEVLLAARAMNKATAILKPHLVKAGVAPIGKVVICTVKGDLHDIGKNLVKMMIEGKGIEAIDLGVDGDPQEIVDTAKKNGAKVICLSALLTTTMTAQKEVIDILKKEGIRDKIKVMVGGAPVNQLYCDEIGADATAPDASSAADICRAYFN